MIKNIFSQKKYLIFIFLVGVQYFTECSTIIKRKDSVQYIQFNQKYPSKEINTINVYKISYPKTPKEKDKFLTSLNNISSRALLDKTFLNTIVPSQLLEDIESIKREETYKVEELYTKYASDLTDKEKRQLEANIHVGYPEDFGDIQGYLNKQVYYWLKYLGREEEYDDYMYYTEFDKDDLMNEIIEKRIELFKTSYTLLDNSIIEITEKNLDMAYTTDNSIYISDKLIKKLDMNKVKSKIIFKNFGESETIYPNKLTMIDGMVTSTIKDYQFYTLIHKEKSLKELTGLMEKDGIKINELNNFSLIKRPEKVLRRATVRKNPPNRDTIEFRTSNSGWVLD